MESVGTSLSPTGPSATPMSSPTTIADPNPAPAPLPPTVPARAHPAVPALASGLLLFFAYPPADRGYLAWFALVPLLTLVRSAKSRWALYLGAWVGGLAFWVLSVNWIWELHPSAWLAWLALATYQSLYWPLFLLLARVMVRKHRLPLMLAAPIAWVGLEYIQAFALSGFPWYYLAHSQYRFLPIIQLSDIFGAWGVSFLVMLANAWLADLLTLPLLIRTARGSRPTRSLVLRTTFLGLALATALGYGFSRIAMATMTDGPVVGLLQSNIQQEMKSKAEPAEILAIYQGLIADALERAKADGRPLDLIVWPETSFPGGYVWIDPKLGLTEIDKLGKMLYPETRARDWLAKRDDVVRQLSEWSRQAKTPMLVGSLLYDLHGDRGLRYNAAILIEPEGGEGTIYRKVHLVPFGEFVPLIDVFPWIRRLTPYENQALPTLAGGPGPVWIDSRGYRYASAICFEGTVPHLVREFFQDPPDGRAPDVLVNISNDGWFRGSAEHDVHLAIGVFRAVENRVPVVRAVNAGISAIIDGNGRILQRLPKLSAGVITASVPLDPRSSLYIRFGDWLAQTCFAVSLGLAILGAVGFPRRGRSQEPRSQSPSTTLLAQGPTVG